MVKITVLPTKYPQGGEKQLVKAVKGREIPAGGLPLDVGCVVQNVGTALAVYEAVYKDKPLIERALTITGACVKNPGNYMVRIGTLLPDIMEELGGFKEEPKKIIVGGPMMGITHYGMDFPVTKGTSGIVFLGEKHVVKAPESVCIRCGRCIEACPLSLMPAAFVQRVKKDNFQEAKDMGIANCCDCGCCAYVCPAKINILDYIKYGKVKIPK